MSLLDKLITVAENEQKVYDAGINKGYNNGFESGKNSGYENGYGDGEEFGRNQGYSDGYDVGYNAGYSKGKSDGYNQGVAVSYSEGFNDGHVSGYDEGYQAHNEWYWDGMLNNGNAANYICRFYRWTNVSIYQPNHNIVHSLIASDSPNQTFRASFFTDLKVDNIFNDISVLSYTFYEMMYLKNARTLHVGVGTSYTNPFGYCNNLEEVRFNGTIGKNGLSFKDCTKLSKDSHISTIEHLSATTSGLTVTFSKTAVNKAFETSSGANDGSTSTEWTTLVASKSNWTISLA